MSMQIYPKGTRLAVMFHNEQTIGTVENDNRIRFDKLIRGYRRAYLNQVMVIGLIS